MCYTYRMLTDDCPETPTRTNIIFVLNVGAGAGAAVVDMGRLSAARRLRPLRDHLCAGAAAAEPPPRLIRGQGGDSHHQAVDAGEDLPPTPLELYQFDLNGCEPPIHRRTAASSCCTLTRAAPAQTSSSRAPSRRPRSTG